LSRIDPTARRLVITGVGFRAAAGTSENANVYGSDSIKPNIGAAVALAAARAGYSIVVVSKTVSKLNQVCESIAKCVPGARLSQKAVDLLDDRAVNKFEADLLRDLEVDIVHCAGLSAGSYALPDDNPYLSLEQTPPDLAVIEFEAVVKSLLIVVRGFLTRLKMQRNASLVVVSSMSGVRAVPWGYSHASAKGGLRQAVRSLTLELNPMGIRVSEVLPGIVNTGLYDSSLVRKAIVHMGNFFGYRYDPENLPKMEPIAVADAVLLCLTSDAHILDISLVARGQFPNLGA
jgi:NAD(P)-dependent dehydrogenase (short-subunit alcohol dehydrogenase family)